MTTKTFDCVEMVEQAQAEIQDMLAAMSREEQLAFWKEQTEKMRELQKQAREQPFQIANESAALQDKT